MSFRALLRVSAYCLKSTLVSCGPNAEAGLLGVPHCSALTSSPVSCCGCCWRDDRGATSRHFLSVFGFPMLLLLQLWWPFAPTGRKPLATFPLRRKVPKPTEARPTLLLKAGLDEGSHLLGLTWRPKQKSPLTLLQTGLPRKTRLFLLLPEQARRFEASRRCLSRLASPWVLC